MNAMQFISVEEFKSKLGISKVEVVKNPNTGKLFAHTTNGNFKVEQTLTTGKDIKFMYESAETFNEGCLVNVTPANPPVAIL